MYNFTFVFYFSTTSVTSERTLVLLQQTFLFSVSAFILDTYYDM